MYKLFEDFKRALKISEADTDQQAPGILSKKPKFRILSVEAVVVMSKRNRMTVTDYLSRIRSVEGVTIVRAEETIEQKLHNTTKLKMKIDAEYLPENSADAIKEQVRSQVLAIPGIVRFTYIKNPVPTNE